MILLLIPLLSIRLNLLTNPLVRSNSLDSTRTNPLPPQPTIKLYSRVPQPPSHNHSLNRMNSNQRNHNLLLQLQVPCRASTHNRNLPEFLQDLICRCTRRDISAFCGGVGEHVEEDETADDFVCCGGWAGEALDRLVADAEGGAAFGVHFYEPGPGVGVGGERRRDWDFVNCLVGADGEALKREVEELGVGC